MKYDFWELEEHVGQLWDKLIHRAARQNHPDAAVYLDNISKHLGVIFRAMGGDCSLSVTSSTATEHRARLGWMQSLSGKHDTIELSWQDSRSLYLPSCIDVFPHKDLNYKLYIWLTAISSIYAKCYTLPWLEYNQMLCQKTIARFPGLRQSYQQLVKAQLELRPDIKSLPADEQQQEHVIQQALKNPSLPLKLPIAGKPPYPVHLWLHPSPSFTDTTDIKSGTSDPDRPEISREVRSDRKHSAKRQRTASDKNQGLLAMRFENIFSWGDFINLDRSSEDEDDLDAAQQAAEDMNQLHVVQDRRSIKSALKFDLDLPSAANDDLPLGDGILLDEWDHRISQYKKHYCELQEMISISDEESLLPSHLHRISRRLKSQFESLTPSRIWYKSQPDGAEIDIDSYHDFYSNRVRGSGEMNANIYQDLRTHHRDLSCLLLADLSLSTDSWVSNDARVIDIIRESLYLFSETLANSGDELAIHGFSSRNRNHVRYHLIKRFTEQYGDDVRSRIHAIKPGFYTRMGAAIRHACNHLQNTSGKQKLLLILTDGKPNDLDIYEGRYGMEDTRKAIQEAHHMGIQPFCVTIDKQAGEYLPYIFGAGHFIMIKKAIELPSKLPLLYARLTRNHI